MPQSPCPIPPMVSPYPTLLIPDSALSVAGLTLYIQTLLEEDDVLQQIWVTGEVSSVSRYPTGLFFTLQDPDAKAAINCVVWSSQLPKLSALPTSGEQLILLGRIKLHPQRGQYQLVVWQILPGGQGLMSLRYRQLRNRLETEGLFDQTRKRIVPVHPQTIAVVTSPRAAAWGDIQRTLQERYPGLVVLLSPALVQGDQAPESIVAAIQRVARDGRAEVLILARGGGAVEDMACFNDERVVRAIADCPIPVITGIGHQRDESLADLVADVCAHTPTAAAEQVVPLFTDIQSAHRQRIVSLQFSIQLYFDTKLTKLQRLQDRLVKAQVHRQLQQQQQSLQWLRQRLTQSATRPFDQARQHCQFLAQTFDSLNPVAVLKRGYAVVRLTDGAIARTAQELQPGQLITIQLGQGDLTAHVIAVTPSSSHSLTTDPYPY